MLGHFDDDGYLFCGDGSRKSSIRGGEEISLREIEEVLLDHPAVAEALAFPLPHPSLGEGVGAAAVLPPGASADERFISAFAAGRFGTGRTRVGTGGRFHPAAYAGGEGCRATRRATYQLRRRLGLVGNRYLQRLREYESLLCWAARRYGSSSL